MTVLSVVTVWFTRPRVRIIQMEDPNAATPLYNKLGYRMTPNRPIDEYIFRAKLPPGERPRVSDPFCFGLSQATTAVAVEKLASKTGT